MFNNCQKFQDFYQGCPENKKRVSCFNYNIGQEYICPSVSPAKEIKWMPLNPWFAAQGNCGCRYCFPMKGNMGQLTICKNKKI